MLKPKIVQWQRRCGHVGAGTSETMIHHPGSHNSLQYSFTNTVAVVVYTLIVSNTTNRNEHKRDKYTFLCWMQSVQSTHHSYISESAVVQLNSLRCFLNSYTNFIRPLHALIINTIIMSPFFLACTHQTTTSSHSQRSLFMLFSKFNLYIISLFNKSFFLKATHLSRSDFWSVCSFTLKHILAFYCWLFQFDFTKCVIDVIIYDSEMTLRNQDFSQTRLLPRR